MKHHHRRGALVLALGPVLGVLVGVAMSPAVGVNHVTIVAPTVGLGEEVRRQMQVPSQASMLFYPLNRLTEQVQQCFRVKDVAVERISPHELQVTVTARQPFAALVGGEDCTIISREGICLYRQAAPPPKLPVLAGMTAARPALGSQLDPEQMLWVTDLVSGAAKVGLEEGLRADFTQPHHITVKTASGLQGVLGNVNHLARKMAIMGRVVEQLRSQGKQPGRVDVSTPETPVWTVK
jgi:cell division septal protein FtsQ